MVVRACIERQTRDGRTGQTSECVLVSRWEFGVVLARGPDKPGICIRNTRGQTGRRKRTLYFENEPVRYGHAEWQRYRVRGSQWEQGPAQCDSVAALYATRAYPLRASRHACRRCQAGILAGQPQSVFSERSRRKVRDLFGECGATGRANVKISFVHCTVKCHDEARRLSCTEK
jgi:hypothetical protein